MSDAAGDEHDQVDEQLDLDAIWGERAQSLVTFIKSKEPPVRAGVVRVFMMQRGWADETLRGVVNYCIKRNLLARHQCNNGEFGLKLPLTPVHEDDAGEPVVNSAGDLLGVASRRTSEALVDAGVQTPAAPQPKAAAPQRGQEKHMSTDWIPAKEAAALIGVKPNSMSMIAGRGDIESKQEGGKGQGFPILYKRASVIAYRDAKRKVAGNSDLLERPARKQRQVKPRVIKLHKSPAQAAQVRAARSPAERLDDVRLLVRVEGMGWIDREAAWARLRELVGDVF